MVRKTKNAATLTFLTLLALYFTASILGSTFLAKEVKAASINATVQIVSLMPNVTEIRCCFKDSDRTTYTECLNSGPTNSYSISGGKPYDMMCNFTVSDINGWQDMSDGWVNITWYHSSVAWNSGLDYDTQYANRSCLNISGSQNGDSINYECVIYGIKYWADAGKWILLVNLSDGNNLGTPGLGNFTLANVTSLWQSNTINFGAMQPGQTGSQWQENTVNVNATTNNTGNTVIDIQVSSNSDNMNCTIGAIASNKVIYDTVYQKGIYQSCGYLTTTSSWNPSCSDINLQDCSDTCPKLEKLTKTYWGIIIPDSGVGGVCSLQLLVMGVQANP